MLDEPANLEVARLLGAFNLLEGEIRTLDPGRNTSRLQVGEFELEGPYFPGHLKGDRVTLCVRPEQLKVSARNGKPGPNQIPADLVRAVERPHGMRLEFSGGGIPGARACDHFANRVREPARQPRVGDPIPERRAAGALEAQTARTAALTGRSQPESR